MLFFICLFDCFKYIKLWGTDLGRPLLHHAPNLIKSSFQLHKLCQKQEVGFISLAISNQVVVAAGESSVLKWSGLQQEAVLGSISYVYHEHMLGSGDMQVLSLPSGLTNKIQIPTYISKLQKTLLIFIAYYTADPFLPLCILHNLSFPTHVYKKRFLTHHVPTFFQIFDNEYHCLT